MTKKNTNAQEVLDSVAEPVAVSQEQAEREQAEYTRRQAVSLALEHHKINGGMIPVPQLLDHAKQFHAYITGETK